MSQIIQLDQHLINKIAAGEVVERPLSVVKELTENAIDAGATFITVEIKDGGLTMVRVTDNGGGIEPGQLPLAFSRHATSKITSIEDLFQVATLGFRGEALSSIASVSQVEIITKTPHAVMGTVVEIHGGEIQSRREIGCANGTTLIVSNLFYNTPARRKFLKKPSTEAGYISDCLERLAMANPQLTIKYMNNGKIVFQSNGSGCLKTVLLNIYGREVATKVLDVDAQEGDLRLFGLIGKPEIARGNRQHGSFFINGRYIQSRLLGKAVETAMKTMLPQGKFPLYALNLTIPFDQLDVNVHPTKMDVRFADEDGVFAFIENALRDALEEHNLTPSMKPKAKPVAVEAPVTQLPLFDVVPDMPEYTPLSEKELAELYIQGGDKKNKTPDPVMDVADFFPATPGLSARENNTRVPWESMEETIPSLTPPEALPEPVAMEKKASIFTNYRIVGLAFHTYWFVEQENTLFIIDQHAAHERVLYEEILKKAQEKAVPSQQLLIPTPLQLTPREAQTLSDNMDIFQNFGFDFDTVHETDTFAMTAVPMMVNDPLQTSFFTSLLDQIDQVGFAKDSVYHHKTELIAMASCKAAVKGGDRLAEAEAKALIQQLMTLDNPFTCPHGRPTIVEMKKSEFERRFKRS